MRICGDKAVPRKVLADGGASSGIEAALQARREMRHRVGIAVKGAVANHRTAAKVEVEHRCETEVDTVRAQLSREDLAQPLRLGGCRGDIAVPQCAQRAHRRNGGEAFAEALHASTFVVNADQQRRCAQRADRRRQRPELGAGFEIAREQDRAAGERMQQPHPVSRTERRSLQPQYHGPARERSAGHDCTGFVAWPTAAASRNSAFIWRTASRNPTNTARDTIAWPMCSSRTPASAATGCTLK